MLAEYSSMLFSILQACANGVYGQDCSMFCGNCFGGEVCNHIDGTCPSGCEPGWVVGTCSEGITMIYLVAFTFPISLKKP